MSATLKKNQYNMVLRRRLMELAHPHSAHAASTTKLATCRPSPLPHHSVLSLPITVCPYDSSLVKKKTLQYYT